MNLANTSGYSTIETWMKSKDFTPFLYQKEAWQSILNGESGIINAPTGCGKTYSVFLGDVIRYLNEQKENPAGKQRGLRLLWISPLRALAKDIARAMEELIHDLKIPWRVGVRNGDTPVEIRNQQIRNFPEVLIITPENLHLLLARKNYPDFFKNLRMVCVDEWHELSGSKRGVQIELALSRIAGLKKQSAPALPFQIWGISATIGNLKEAADILLAPLKTESENNSNTKIISANIRKKIVIESVFPDELDTYPWAGHLGIKLVHKVIPIIQNSKTTLIFINTRGMSEAWYHSLLHVMPELAGSIALHHGSVEPEIRNWIEENLHEGKLKVVVCTSSLDLGVDFRPVETVIQVGSPKGVSRFMQRAGRSGHGPGETSKIFFLPTHSLELAEASALKFATKNRIIESRRPLFLCFDVLLQYLTTLGISDGFEEEAIYREIKSTFCYSEITREEFRECILFLTHGGKAFAEYDEFKKLELIGTLYKVTDRRIAMRHRMHIGTIVSDPMMKVKLFSGGYVGAIEESFIARLNPGDVFSLAGKTLEFVTTKGMTAITKKSKSKKSIIPSWQGGRMSLSANMGYLLRKQLALAALNEEDKGPELTFLKPLIDLQSYLSHIPDTNELLIEQIETKDGFHLFVYPFEGRVIHETMAALVAYRISKMAPITFSIAMNDYGFELLSDQPIPVEQNTVHELFTVKGLTDDLQHSLNNTELAKRKFREIAAIGGLIFQGYPGSVKKARHLQSSSSLLFDVLREYDHRNLLLRQAYHEAMEYQVEEERLRSTMERIGKGKFVITYPNRLTPFCFPIKVDSMRENLTSEKLEDRIRKMVGGLQ